MTDLRSIGRWTMAGQPSAAGAARARVREALAAHPRLDDIELVTSELVANAAEHGDGDIELLLEAGPELLRLTVVSDVGLGEPEVRSATVEDEGGRGLAIVEATADRWEWDRVDGRLAVWAEFWEH
jgi:anti-sigma regulatory factor (Ser/Thr protein kinase)